MKKLLTIMLVLAMSLSMAACGTKTEAVVDEAPAVVDEATTDEAPAEDPAETADDVAEGTDETATASVEGELPEIDGLTKMDMGGMTVYQNDTGSSAIAVIPTPADPTIAEAIENKNEEALADVTAQQEAAYPGATVTSEFVTVGGKNAYKLDMSIPAGGAIPVDSKAVVYMFTAGEEFYVISAAETSGDDVSAIAKQAEELIAAL